MTKEKQIEEMANELATLMLCDKNLMSVCEKFYNAGYRKQSEGEWILHKPRRENRNATYKCSVCGKLCSSYYNDVGEWKCCPHCQAKMKGGAE